MDVCRANSETVLACLDKRLQSMNPRVQMHALTVRGSYLYQNVAIGHHYYGQIRALWFLDL